MKRKEILKKLRNAGFTLKEGGKHTKVYKDGVWVSTLSRQAEIPDSRVRDIEAQIGIKLK